MRKFRFYHKGHRKKICVVLRLHYNIMVVIAFFQLRFNQHNIEYNFSFMQIRFGIVNNNTIVRAFISSMLSYLTILYSDSYRFLIISFR